MPPEKFSYPDKPGQPFVVPKAEMPQVRPLTEKELKELGLITGKQKKKTERIKEGISMGEAKEILGEDVIGAEDIEKVWGLTPEVPPIPFSREDIETAKKLGQFLILRIEKAKDGAPLTMLKIHEELSDEYQKKNYGKVLFDTRDKWKLNSAFFTTETPRARWALVSKELIPNSTSKNYVAQTDEIETYLRNSVFDGRSLPKEFAEAVEEWNREKAAIKTLIPTDWQQAAQKLEKLKITELTRQTPVETHFDICTYLLSRGERLLETKYTWTSRRSSEGNLVYVGNADAAGAYVVRVKPENSNPHVGVVFSRSL